MIERTYYCDGPTNPDINDEDLDPEGGCPRHVVTTNTSSIPGGFIKMTQSGSVMHFCSWDCVLRFAATIEPETVIE